MSTTTDRKVAMGYAAGDGQKMGIVLEMQQGMVNRGADISWLSQAHGPAPPACPHFLVPLSRLSTARPAGRSTRTSARRSSDR